MSIGSASLNLKNEISRITLYYKLILKFWSKYIVFYRALSDHRLNFVKLNAAKYERKDKSRAIFFS